MSLGPVETNRLRWQCRRGLLENDLILERFLDRHGEQLEGEQLMAFKGLLALGDNDLWDILSGRMECPPGASPAVREVVDLLRAC